MLTISSSETQRQEIAQDSQCAMDTDYTATQRSVNLYDDVM